MKTILREYILGFLLALVLYGLLLIAELIPNIGWHLMTVFFALIFVLQLTFYVLTTNFKLGLTVLSFILNFFIWTLELVILEKLFHNSWVYKEPWISMFILGGLLWTTNKIMLDKLFELNKNISTKTSVLERRLIK